MSVCHITVPSHSLSLIALLHHRNHYDLAIVIPESQQPTCSDYVYPLVIGTLATLKNLFCREIMESTVIRLPPTLDVSCFPLRNIYLSNLQEEWFLATHRPGEFILLHLLLSSSSILTLLFSFRDSGASTKTLNGDPRT